MQLVVEKPQAMNALLKNIGMHTYFGVSLFETNIISCTAVAVICFASWPSYHRLQHSLQNLNDNKTNKKQVMGCKRSAQKKHLNAVGGLDDQHVGRGTGHLRRHEMPVGLHAVVPGVQDVNPLNKKREWKNKIKTDQPTNQSTNQPRKKRQQAKNVTRTHILYTEKMVSENKYIHTYILLEI